MKNHVFHFHGGGDVDLIDLRKIGFEDISFAGVRSSPQPTGWLTSEQI